MNGASPTTAPPGSVAPDEFVGTVVTGTVVAALVVAKAVVTGPVVAGTAVAATVVAASGAASVVVGADETELAVESFADSPPHPASMTKAHANRPRMYLTFDDPNRIAHN